MNELSKLMMFGNTKLPKTTAIFNMGPAHTCPSSALGLCELRKTGGGCKDTCYALKAEKQYHKTALPYRTRQQRYWLTVSAETFAREFIEVYQRKRIKPTLLRFNESGDFYTQECYNKANKIAKILKAKIGVISYTYTHRTDLHYINFNQSLNVLKSGHNGNDYLAANYKAVDPALFEQLKGEQSRNNRNALLPQDMYYICPGDCKKCSLCAHIKVGTIYTQVH